MKLYIINPLYLSLFLVIIFTEYVSSWGLDDSGSSGNCSIFCIDGKTYVNSKYEIVDGGHKTLRTDGCIFSGIKSYKELSCKEKSMLLQKMKKYAEERKREQKLLEVERETERQKREEEREMERRKREEERQKREEEREMGRRKREEERQKREEEREMERRQREEERQKREEYRLAEQKLLEAERETERQKREEEREMERRKREEERQKREEEREIERRQRDENSKGKRQKYDDEVDHSEAETTNPEFERWENINRRPYEPRAEVAKRKAVASKIQKRPRRRTRNTTSRRGSAGKNYSRKNSKQWQYE